MKIGQLAKLCGVSVATVRYYVSMGMLIPNDSSAQYDFSEREVEDLNLILKMRKHQFKLKEIQQYLILTRHSRMIEPSTINAALTILETKQQEIFSEIEELKNSYREIGEEIHNLREKGTAERRVTGVPVSALPLFACPYCGESLNIEDAEIKNGYIISGKLVCSGHGNGTCEKKYEAKIVDGIVETGNLYTGIYDHPDLKRGLYRDMGPEFSFCFQRCYDRVTESLMKDDMNGKVFLEANINGYFYMYNHLGLLPASSTLILIDKYPEILRMYKALIEQCNIKCQILYIADAGTDYPLKSSCVDRYITFCGEGEYMLYHQNCYLMDAARYFKDDVRVHGTYLSYDRTAKSRKNLLQKYPESSSREFQMEYLMEDYKKCGYEMAIEQMGAITDCGARVYAFACQVIGEVMRIYSITAWKKGHKPETI